MVAGPHLPVQLRPLRRAEVTGGQIKGAEPEHHCLPDGRQEGQVRPLQANSSCRLRGEQHDSITGTGEAPEHSQGHSAGSSRWRRNRKGAGEGSQSYLLARCCELGHSERLKIQIVVRIHSPQIEEICSRQEATTCDT